MYIKKMLFTGEKESFIARVLIKKVQEARIDCEFVPCNVTALGDKLEDIQLIALYMEDGYGIAEDVLHYLTDTLEEKGGMLILIGEANELKFVNERVPSDLIYHVFTRPVDNSEFVSTVSDFFNKMDSGEFKKSILIVDDDPQYLNLVRQWLKGSYKVFMANSGLQAIKFLGKNKVDLILLDHEMPKTSGPQVLEMIRSDDETRSIPVMFLTGKSDKESVMAVVALKPEGYFLKNIKSDELLEKLKEFFILHSAK